MSFIDYFNFCHILQIYPSVPRWSLFNLQSAHRKSFEEISQISVHGRLWDLVETHSRIYSRFRVYSDFSNFRLASLLRSFPSLSLQSYRQKLLTMLPTKEEKSRIQEAQAANPDLPLGSAEQFLLTLTSISELPARLKLWAFKLDFENSEKVSKNLFVRESYIHMFLFVNFIYYLLFTIYIWGETHWSHL